jgi:hypothetical protein
VQRLLVPPDTTSSSYTYQYCAARIQSSSGEVFCALSYPIPMDPLKISPPFTYSYQCGSTLLTSYIPVYMYSISFQILSLFLKLIMVYFSSFINYPTWLIEKFNGIYWTSYWTSGSPPVRMVQPHQILSFVMNYLVLLLSFGLCSPVLGCYITLCLSLHLLSWLVLIGRFASARIALIHHHSLISNPINRDLNIDADVPNLSNDDEYLNALNQEFELLDLRGSLSACKWPVICNSCFFMTILCWDIAGDEVGWFGALWVPLSGIAMILVLWLWNRFLDRRVPSFQSSSPASSPFTYSIEFITSTLHLSRPSPSPS